MQEVCLKKTIETILNRINAMKCIIKLDLISYRNLIPHKQHNYQQQCYTAKRDKLGQASMTSPDDKAVLDLHRLTFRYTLAVRREDECLRLRLVSYFDLPCLADDTWQTEQLLHKRLQLLHSQLGASTTDLGALPS